MNNTITASEPITVERASWSSSVNRASWSAPSSWKSTTADRASWL
jgi:hypothetical protein